MHSFLKNLDKKRVTVMGLGVHGGGSAVARYCALQGAEVTVTDIRNEHLLTKSINELSNLNIRYVLGRHERDDFINADIIIKNPAVPRNSPWLMMASEQKIVIESDISIFLDALYQLSAEGSKDKIVLSAITGTKGKSNISNIIHQILQKGAGLTSYLGGNITYSPLHFLDNIRSRLSTESVYIVLELSSFQIGDLRLVIESRLRTRQSAGIYWPDYALLSNILPDHQDYYPDMSAYVADKLFLFQKMKESAPKIIGKAGRWSKLFLGCGNTKSAVGTGLAFFNNLEGYYMYAAHQRENLDMVCSLLEMMSIEKEKIRRGVSKLTGLPHRLQYIGSLLNGRVRVINDSAATIPEAALRAVESFQNVYLICGGSDKDLDLSPLVRAMNMCSAVYLLAGSASDRLRRDMTRHSIRLFTSIDDAIQAAYIDLKEGILQNMSIVIRKEGKNIPTKQEKKESAVLLLSPGCASFGIFLNEFDRGERFVKAIQHIPDFKTGEPKGPDEGIGS